jgi:hypothetical protein
MNKQNRLKKHFFRVSSGFGGGDGKGWSIFPSCVYTARASSMNQRGLATTVYMPIRQPGETGPKPMTANTLNTRIHLIRAMFIKLGYSDALGKVDYQVITIAANGHDKMTDKISFIFEI